MGFQSYIACLKLSVCLSLSLLRLLRQPQFFSLLKAYICDSCDFNILKKGLISIHCTTSIYQNGPSLYQTSVKKNKITFGQCCTFWLSRQFKSVYKCSSLSNKFQTSLRGYTEESNNIAKGFNKCTLVIKTML